MEGGSALLHLVTLDEVPTEYWTWDGDEWVHEFVARTGGLSMPSYAFEDRVPEAIRGVFTISASSATKKLFHEMGHKLLNVSHEGATVCPSFEADGPELMLYGAGTFIGGGFENRWHAERLLQSPYLYRPDPAGDLRNPGYVGTGNYSDELYGDHIVDPVCD